MRTPPRTRSTMAAILLAVALTTGACSGDDASPPDGEPTTAPSSAAPAPIGTRARIGKVTGKLSRERRQHLRGAVRDVVDAWFDAAYVGGDFPRHDFQQAWPGFTPDAKAEAHHDRRLMSNAGLGQHIEGVRATRKQVRVDVLAVHQRPVGVTARFVLDFVVDGKAPRKVEVKGRLFLTRTQSGWRVFGYDATRGDAR